MLVRGSGRTPADYFLLGSHPGWREDREGRPFVGDTGQEFDRLLAINRLPARKHWFLSNLIQQYGGHEYDYVRADYERDEPMVLKELDRAQPSTIVTLGREATQFLLGDVDLDGVWGLPWYLPKSEKWALREDTVVVPSYHIASGFRNSESSALVIAGFNGLAAYLRGEIEPRTLFDDPFVGKEVYEDITSEFQLDAALCKLTPSSILSLDTEGWAHRPWSVQFSYEPGRAYLLRATAGELLRRFSACVGRIRPRLAFHSSLHDLGVGRVMGLDSVGTLTYDDTMVAAYLLQLEPKGLKAGCLRHCNMQMDDYSDLLGDTADQLAIEYLTWLYDLEQDDYARAQRKEFDARRAAGRRIKVLPKLPRTALHRAVTRVLQSKRPHGLWLDQVEDIQIAGYRRLGPFPTATLDYIPAKKAVTYACRDADGTGRLLPELMARVDALGLRDVYDLELSTYPFIDRMQQVGIKPDLAHFAALSTRLDHELGTVRARLAASTGDDSFNANSGDQVADYLYGTLGLDPGRSTKEGERGSTDKKYLKALEYEHPEYPVIGQIRQYRELYKLKNSFVDVVPDLIKGWPNDGRIHILFKTTTIPTGRLAATMPEGFPKYNMLAQPKRGPFANEFNQGWIADDGHVVCEWDQSQIELRVGAHLSQDPYMLAVYRGEVKNPDGSPVDLHAGLAHRIFGVFKKDQTNTQRVAAKEINFGFWMGQTAVGLVVSLRKNGVDVDEDDAQQWIDEANRTYVGAQPYKDRMVAEAEKNGYVRCLSGRIRYIGGIRSRDEKVRAEAQRFAFSTPVQEGAQFIMKQGEASLYEDVLVPLWKQGRWVEPILQIHDAIRIECEERLARDLHVMVETVMTNVTNGLSVPLEVEGKYGHNLGPVVVKGDPTWSNPRGMREFE